MRTKLILAGVAVAVLVAVYLAGALPAERAQMAAEAQTAALETQLAAAQARLRVSELLGQLLAIEDLVRRQDYGQAQPQSSAFFDAVRNEVAATTDTRLREGLTAVLAQRDSVTAALAKADPIALEALRTSEFRLRRTLGFPAPTEQ